ncbi:transglycosylase SLT domain-containing protein [uncultured Acinetobacter sp.]|uniref:lytic transglycosylase domain-containing protein n=3 Tax=Acinetobacter TaxID=469 RepID=UPI0025897447|nr:transglycosylase SLT domain-containing protein [uncultured Acinetobacter sp.]
MKPIQYTITAVDRATAVVDKISNRIDRLNQPFSRLERSVKRFGDVSGVSRLAKGVGELTNKATALLGVVLKLGTPLLALFGGGSIIGLYQMTEGWAKLGSATQRTSQILGIGIDNLMSWQNLGTMFGVSADQMTQSIQGFSDTLQDAKWGRNQAAFGMLQTLGIGLKQTKDGVIDTESMLVKFADKIRAIQKRDPAAARRLAQSFGIESIMPVLMQGGTALRRYQAEVKQLQGNIPPGAIDRASKFSTSIDKMKIASNGTKAAIADKLIPVFQPLIEKWTKWLVLNRTDISDKIAKLAERIANWIDKIDFNATLEGITKFLDGCVNIAKWIDKVVDKFGGWENVIKGVGILIGVGFVANIALAVGGVLGLIGKLALATSGMTALGSATGITIAAIGGWKIGSWINEKFVEGTDFGDWLGDKIARVWQHAPDWAGGKTAREAVAINDRLATKKFVPPSGKELIQSKLLFESLESKYGLSKGLLDRQWFAESGRGKNMLSPAGATGHFQFMPATAKRFGLSRSDTFDINKSAVAASRYMSWLKNRYKGSERLAAMAYNWGEGNVDSYIKNGHGIKTSRNPTGAVPQETRGYLEKIFGTGANVGNGSQQAQVNVSVNTTVHPNGATVTKVETPQGVKISHNQPGEGFSGRS